MIIAMDSHPDIVKTGGKYHYHFCVIICQPMFRNGARLDLRCYEQSQDLDAGIGHDLNMYRSVITHPQASDGVIIGHLPELLELSVAINFFK